MLNNPNPQDLLNSISQESSIEKEKHPHQAYIQLLKSILPIFQLPHEQRSSTQLNQTYQILRNIQFFKTLEIFSSPQTIKSLIKHGKLLQLRQNYQICQKDTPLNNFIFAINGNFGLIDNPIEEPIRLYDQQTHLQFFQKFKNFSPSYLQFFKKKQHIKTYKTYRPQKAFIEQGISSKLLASPSTQLLFLGEKVFQNKYEPKKYSQSIVTLARQNLIFLVDFKKFCELMRQEYNKSLTKQMNLFLTFSCFSLFKKEILRQFVEGTEKIKLKKNDILFKQGQQDNRIFILKCGEIQLEKTASLNEQNPNDFYKNRLFIKRSSIGQKIEGKIQSIPFADFTKVFNAKTIKKKIKLSCVSPISILGEEEIISKKYKRQTTAKVISPEAELSVFYLCQIQKLIPNGSTFTIQTFLKILEQEITNKKILFRQQKLGSDIIYFNKTNKNGFFLNESNRRSLQSRKNINCLGKTISTQKKKFIDSELEINKLFVTASFTCHNFEEFYQTERQNEMKLEKIKQIRPSSNADCKQEQVLKYTNEEREIIKLLHDNQQSNRGNNRRKTGRSQNRSQSKIDLEKPLFSAEYFKHQIERSRKLDKDIRKFKLKGLYSKSTLSTSFQNRKFKTLSTSTIVNSTQKNAIKRHSSTQK